jgi:predicted membrane channel-forming protein YqfA (hemolysin III family)
MLKTQGMPLKVRVLWRALFWSGIVALIIGTGLSTAYINDVVQSQVYLFLGFAVIIFGVALMTIGYLVSQEKIKNSERFKHTRSLSRLLL